MKIRNLISAAAAVALIAGPAIAVERTYQTTATNQIVTPTATGGFTIFPAGSWEGPQSRVVIDDASPLNGGNPLLVSATGQSQLVNNFGCLSTSGVTGCVVRVVSDTIADGAAGGPSPGTVIGTGTSNLGGDIVTFANTTVQLVGGRGQWCSASIDPAENPTPSTADLATIAAYCDTVLSLTQDAWDDDSPSLSVISPNNAGEFHFNATYTEYENPNAYRYFELAGLENVVYGRYLQGFGVSPQPLPVPLAPLAALALGGSLAYMGMSSLRRKK